MKDSTKQTLKLLFVVIISVTALVYLFRYCDKKQTTQKIVVKYEIIGDSPEVVVNFLGLQGTYQQFTDISLPWSYTEYVYVSDPRNFYIQLQGSTRAEGSVLSRIYVNDIIVKEAFSRGKYVSAISSVTFSSEDELLE